MTSELLLKTLDELGDEEFKRFKWCLQQPDILDDSQTITVSKLEKADRQDTADLMLRTFEPDEVVTVAEKVLKKINRNDLVRSGIRQLGTRR